MARNKTRFDAIVIGSGIGGLTAAAALAKRGRRILVLEQHYQLGGLTQTFSRGAYTFATGVHYVGGVGAAPGPENLVGRLLHWLSDGRLRFSPISSPFDIVRICGSDFPIESPRALYIARLKKTFPQETAAIDAYFADCDAAQKANAALFMARALPAALAAPLRWFNTRRVRLALDRTTAEVVVNINDRHLAALLAARWGDYGLDPTHAPFAVHALVTGSYAAGAYYPVGGPAQFSAALAETITSANGALRTHATVAEICVLHGHATGVRLTNGEIIDAPLVISAMGGHNTVAVIPAGVAAEWCQAVKSLKSGLSYVSLYLGFHGDIRQFGATPANIWLYESDDITRVWERPWDEDAPAMFVSFPSLKDPAHGDSEHHTAEVLVFCRWEPFAKWAQGAPGHRPDQYADAKALLANKLLAQFTRHFPRLAPLIDLHEISTPLSQASFVRADHGAMYGLEMSARRMRDSALNIRTPVPGLLLAGQDAASPGIQGACMGGFMAAASAEPALWKELTRS